MRSKWRLFLFVGLILLLASSVIGCAPSYTKKDVDAAREAGYSEGYAAGKAEGYDEGYAKGKAVGLIAGLAQSKLSEEERIKPPLTPTPTPTPTPAPTPMPTPTPTPTPTVTLPPPIPTFQTLTPSGATALCRDGTYSYSQNRRGTCSWHGGVYKWLR